MTVDERALCATTAHFIRSYSSAGAVSLMVTALGLVLLFLGDHSVSTALLVAVLATGMVERYLALRLQFDGGLFDELARNEHFDLQNMDGALQALNLRKADVTPRDLIARIRGTRRLYRVHTACVGLQLALMLVTAFV